MNWVKNFFKNLLVLLILVSFPTISVAQTGNNTSTNNMPPFLGIGLGRNAAYCPFGASGNLASFVARMPAQPLSLKEKEGLIKMTEEEKLARDVYQALYKKWRMPIFNMIAQTEQRHLETMRALLKKYNLKDPVEGLKSGEFKSNNMRTLYKKLVLMGNKSVIDALKVGDTIEDLDIHDLKLELRYTDNQDIKVAYQNLLKGSRNHMRAFTRMLLRTGENYTPKYISQKEFNAIINSSIERGIYNADGTPMFRRPMMRRPGRRPLGTRGGGRGAGRGRM